MAVILDGQRMVIEPDDIDGDGKVGGTEVIHGMRGVREIQQNTELGDVMNTLTKDELEPHTDMSSVDFISRLHFLEVPSLTVIDTLVGLRVYPRRTLKLTRQKKRLSVSVAGKGREEMRDVAIGKREQDSKSGISGMSIADRIKGFLPGGNKE